MPAAAIIAALSVQRRIGGARPAIAALGALDLERLAQRAVGRDAAGEQDAPDAERRGRRGSAFRTSIFTAVAWNEAHTSATPSGAERRVLADVETHGGLEPREREVRRAVLELGEREPDGLRVPLPRGALHRGAARIAEPEELRDLVEGLAGGVVPRLPDQAIAERGLAGVERACGRRTRRGRGTAARASGPRAGRRRCAPRGGSRRRGGAGGRRRGPWPPTGRRGASPPARGRGSPRSRRGPASARRPRRAPRRPPGARPRDADARRARAPRRRSARGSGPGTRRRSTAASRRPARPRPSRRRSSRCRGRACAGSRTTRRTGSAVPAGGTPAGTQSL